MQAKEDIQQQTILPSIPYEISFIDTRISHHQLQLPKASSAF